jgi:FixJ family two-component response regulator
MLGMSATVVVVEDDASMRQAIERVLRAGGFAPITFETAEAVLETGAAASADCLVLDIRLPGMSGLELCRQLASSLHGVPAIFITAHDGPAVREEVGQLGAGGFLPKPFSGRALLDAVNRALGA